jgi:Ni/Fe-hydrogenase subunit HybB-like protein
VSLINLSKPDFAVRYLPHPMEFAITISVISAGVLAFGLVARYLPLFVEHAPEPTGR